MGASVLPIAAGISALTGVGGAVASGLSSKQSTPTFNSTAAGLNGANSSYLENILQDPQAGMGPIASAGTQAIDNSYAGSADTISRMMASRGYGSSGSMGNTMYQTNLSRLGSLSQFNGTMAQLESQRQMQASGDVNQLIGLNTGQNVSTPGAGLANGLMSSGSALGSNLSIMAMLQAMLTGGSSPYVTPSGVNTGIPNGGNPSLPNPTLIGWNGNSTVPVSPGGTSEDDDLWG